MFAPSIGATSFAAPIIHAEAPPSESHSPTFRFTEVQKHVPDASKKWVTRSSGNRRSHMISEARSTEGIQWQLGVIFNSEWTGVRLRDALKDAGFPVNDMPNDIKHAQFMGAEVYGTFIPIDTAVAKYGDVILAYAMNDRPLPPDHGYPLRLVVPSNVAYRSVKWINRVSLSDEESSSKWQRSDYRCCGSNVSGDPDLASTLTIQEMLVQNAVTSLRVMSRDSEGAQRLLKGYGLTGDSIIVEGYCFSGGGRKIVRVAFHADDGRTWHQADLLPDESHGTKAWAWKRWRWVLPRCQAGKSSIVKAVDEAYNTQRSEYEPDWNFRGNLTSAWHRIVHNIRFA